MIPLAPVDLLLSVAQCDSWSSVQLLCAFQQGTSALRVQHADTLSDYLQSHSQLMAQLTETERRELNRGWGVQVIQPDSISAYCQVSKSQKKMTYAYFILYFQTVILTCRLVGCEGSIYVFNH